MKQKPIKILFYVTSVLFYIAALIGYFYGNSMKTVWLCLCLMWLFIGAVRLKKSKKTNEKSKDENKEE